MGKTITDDQARVLYDCAKCPAFCCAIYDRVQVTKRDIKRLAKHFGVTYEVAERRYTTLWQKEPVLRRKADHIFGKACKFLDPESRGCTIYHARPGRLPRVPGAAALRLLRYDPVRA